MIRFRFLLLGFLLLSACGDDDGPPRTTPPPTATRTSASTASPTPTRTAVHTGTPLPTAAGTPRSSATPSPSPTGSPSPSPTETLPAGTPVPPECCGDGLVDPSVECDDGNQIGGDGCAANCSGERLLEVATRLRATVQTALFAIPLAGDAVHRLVLGRPTHAAGMPSCFGGPSFRGGEVPVVERAGASEYAPISVPGLVCACVRPEAVKRCGPPLLNPPGPDCSLGRPCEVDSDCDDDEPCASAHGGDNSASGVIGCAGLDDVDYEATVELGVATCTRGGGPAPAGSALLHTSLRLGTITGNCFVDEGDPNKGADGIPCTEDDPASSRGGDPGTSLLTTGTARVALFSGDVVIEPERACGGSPCVASVTGSPFSCEALAAEPPETGAVALCGASALLAQAQTGDSVLTTCIEPQP